MNEDNKIEIDAEEGRVIISLVMAGSLELLKYIEELANQEQTEEIKEIVSSLTKDMDIANKFIQRTLGKTVQELMS